MFGVERRTPNGDRLPMNTRSIIAKTKDYIRTRLSGECTGHDWFHTERVWRVANYLSSREGGDSAVVQLAALLHDIADWKFHDGNHSLGAKLADEWLSLCDVSNPIRHRVCHIVEVISFKGAGHTEKPSDVEGKIVQDSDRLDAIGAIGIARAFAYGGFRGQPIYDPAKTPAAHRDFEAYKKASTTTINHFYEKLLLLAERMNTQTAREMARRRHDYLRNFLQEFMLEWNFDSPNE